MIFASATGLLFVAIIFLGTIIGSLILIYLGLFSDFTELYKTHKIKLIIVVVVTTLLGSMSALMIYSTSGITKDIRLQAERKKSREQFTLTEAHQYGDLLLPKGTKIYRSDPFDNGEENRAFRLTGLRNAIFPEPLQIASVWASEIDLHGLLRLSKDQEILGEKFKAMQWIRFRVPHIDYDVLKEFGKEDPDGADARLKTSDWTFREPAPDWKTYIDETNTETSGVNVKTK